MPGVLSQELVFVRANETFRDCVKRGEEKKETEHAIHWESEHLIVCGRERVLACPRVRGEESEEERS